MSMLLSELLQDIKHAATVLPEVTVGGVQDDSRLLQAGEAYCAIASVNPDGTHGIAYALDAIAAGAVVILVEPTAMPSDTERLMGLKASASVPIVEVERLGWYLGEMVARLNGKPSATLHVTGITGTDGKTSVAHLLTQAHAAKGRAAMVGTLGYGELQALQPATHTTPPPVALQGWFTAFVEQGIARVNMEVSSHALAQNRVGGVAFETAVLTNLGRDHLDYHGDMEGYKAAKALLFAWPSLKYAVLNVDDVFGLELQSALADGVAIIGYGRDRQALASLANFVAFTSKPTADGLHIQFDTHAGSATLNSSLLGDFNANNLAAVLAVLLVQGAELAAAINILADLEPVDGRMARYGGNQQPLVVVDYAHTADALRAALSALRPHTLGQLICVFGCGGDRDRGKRPLMAAAAEQGADQVMLTSDNPRTEDPAAILTDIQSGLTQPEAVTVELDRRAAIHAAIAAASVGDVVLVAGKGHEDYQIMGTQKHRFDDAEVVQDALMRWVA